MKKTKAVHTKSEELHNVLDQAEELRKPRPCEQSATRSNNKSRKSHASWPTPKPLPPLGRPWRLTLPVAALTKSWLQWGCAFLRS